MKKSKFSHLPFDIQCSSGATALDPNEIEGLIPSYIFTQAELNILEQQNILAAKTWLLKRKKKEPILTDSFLRGLHKKMFSDVWKWAGQYRRSDKTIGIAWSQISQEILKLLVDTQYWIEHQTYQWNELGARFHHRLVSIHPFPNGNGRHARIMTDILFETNDLQPPTWGTKLMVITNADGLIDQPNEIRDQYILSLKEADQRRFEKLIKFMES